MSKGVFRLAKSIRSKLTEALASAWLPPPAERTDVPLAGLPPPASVFFTSGLGFDQRDARLIRAAGRYIAASSSSKTGSPHRTRLAYASILARLSRRRVLNSSRLGRPIVLGRNPRCVRRSDNIPVSSETNLSERAPSLRPPCLASLRCEPNPVSRLSHLSGHDALRRAKRGQHSPIATKRRGTSCEEIPVPPGRSLPRAAPSPPCCRHPIGRASMPGSPRRPALHVAGERDDSLRIPLCGEGGSAYLGGHFSGKNSFSRNSACSPGGGG